MIKYKNIEIKILRHIALKSNADLQLRHILPTPIQHV